MTPQQWFRPPRAVLTLFLCLMLACALALGWLGWQVLVQDRAVEAQRRQERLESAADRAVTAMERVTMAASGAVEVTPAGRLACVPVEVGSAQARAAARCSVLEESGDRTAETTVSC